MLPGRAAAASVAAAVAAAVAAVAAVAAAAAAATVPLLASACVPKKHKTRNSLLRRVVLRDASRVVKL